MGIVAGWDEKQRIDDARIEQRIKIIYQVYENFEISFENRLAYPLTEVGREDSSTNCQDQQYSLEDPDRGHAEARLSG